MTENAARAGASAVALLHAVGEDMFHQVEILAHGRGSPQKGDFDSALM